MDQTWVHEASHNFHPCAHSSWVHGYYGGAHAASTIITLEIHMALS